MFAGACSYENIGVHTCAHIFVDKRTTLSTIFSLSSILLTGNSYFCLHVYMHTSWVPDIHGGQKNISEPLELELKMIVSHHGYVDDEK